MSLLAFVTSSTVKRTTPRATTAAVVEMAAHFEQFLQKNVHKLIKIRKEMLGE